MLIIKTQNGQEEMTLEQLMSHTDVTAKQADDIDAGREVVLNTFLGMIEVTTKKKINSAHISPEFAYVIETEDGVDQVCETDSDAKREAKDLRDMGCKVKTHKCAWLDQDIIIAKIEAKFGE